MITAAINKVIECVSRNWVDILTLVIFEAKSRVSGARDVNMMMSDAGLMGDGQENI